MRELYICPPREPRLTLISCTFGTQKGSRISAWGRRRIRQSLGVTVVTVGFESRTPSSKRARRVNTPYKSSSRTDEEEEAHTPVLTPKRTGGGRETEQKKATVFFQAQIKKEKGKNDSAHAANKKRPECTCNNNKQQQRLHHYHIDHECGGKKK